MLILSIRTDKPESEIGLFEDNEKLFYDQWEAHRALSDTLHNKIKKLLASQKKSLQDIEAIVVYEGPGSFTGLRIGISVANALTYALGVPITAASSEAWIKTGITRLLAGHGGKQVVPVYGKDVHISSPRS